MAYSADFLQKKFVASQNTSFLLSPPAIRKDSIPDESDEARLHIGIEHLPKINKIILDYYAPQRNSNDTGFIKDELSEYVTYLENKNKSLSLRIAKLETKFKAIEPYIPTIIKIIRDYTTAEERIEKKKKYLIKEYSIKKPVKMKLWAGAEEKVDIANTSLDEMLSDIEE